MRWWMWVVAGLLLLICLAIAVRIHGTIAFAETQAELKRMGFHTTMEEFVVAGPTVDQDRQRRLRRLMDAGGGWRDNISYALPFNDLQEQRPPTKDLAKRDQALRDGTADMAALAAILAEGPVELSFFGWCERDPAKLRAIDLTTAVATPLPPLLACRAWANWWSIRACLDADPEPHLDNLDHLVGAMDHPGTLIDAMIGIATRAIRDQTCLWLATRGRLQDSRLMAWTAEPSLHRARCAAGFAGERCIFQEPLSRTSLSYSTLRGYSGSFFVDVMGSSAIWPTQGHEAAYCSSYLAATEAALLDRPRPTLRTMPFGYPGVISPVILPNLSESGITATEAAYRHRLARCAAMLAVACLRDGNLPSVIPAGAPAAAIDANQPAVAYERLSDSRFRIGFDPAGSAPPIMPAGRITTAIGRPAGVSPASAFGGVRWSLEIDLDAILIPPPEKPAKARAP